MGELFYDKFSLLHLASGIVAYYWNITFIQWFTLHAIFEFVENTESGVNFIDTYLKIWPGGKEKSDTLLNNSGDQLFAMIGWLIPYLLYKK
jgi:hypothetical protein